MMDDNNNVEILTLSEVANYLKISEKSVLRMIHKGEIPCSKIASQWRFVKSMIDDWVLSKMNVVPHNDLVRLTETNISHILISRLTEPELIMLDVKSGSKESILAQLLIPLKENGIIDDPENFMDALVKREKLITTAIGQGIAIPHARRPEETNYNGGPKLVIGVCPEGTDFEALDGGSTYIFFLLLTDSEVVHLKVLSLISRMIAGTNLVEQFKQAKSSNTIMQYLIEYDYNLDKNKNS